MGRTYFKAKKDNTGGLLDISFSSKDEKFWFNIVKQNGWQDGGPRGGNGIFKDGKKANVSLNLPEIGGIIRTLEDRRTLNEGGGFSFYHTSDRGTTSGSFTYYFIPVKEEDKKRDPKLKPREGFGFSIKQGDVDFKVGLTMDEGRELLEYLKYGMTHCYDFIYSEDKKRAQEFAAKKEGNNGNTTNQGKRGKTAKKVETAVTEKEEVTEDSANAELQEEENKDELDF